MSDRHDLIGAYVLDALDEDDRAAFEQYLETSPEAADEVAHLREALAALAPLTAETPPATLKARVLQQVDQTWQNPVPVSSPRQTAESTADDTADDTANDTADAGAEDAVAIDHDADDVVVSLAERAQSRRAGSTDRLTRVAFGVAAVAAGLAAVLAISLAQLNDQLDSIQRAADQVAAVVVAEDSQRIAVPVEGGGTLSAVISIENGAAVVVADGLDEIGGDEIYALWAIDGGIPAPVGELTAGEAVAVTTDFDLLGLTVEPDGPLEQPTGDILALLEA